MKTTQPAEHKRQRAPSKRALATKARVFDAAEQVFAERGFDGATIRDIAAAAGEPVGTIHHHGGGKEALFFRTVARRAQALSAARLAALAPLKANGDLTVQGLIGAFMRPFLDLSRADPGWQAYARLVALVSADDRWREISATCFDETADRFMVELLRALPNRSREEVAEGLVFAVSAMLALITSRERIAAMGNGGRNSEKQEEHLIRFCVAGMSANEA
ncbi:MAG: TetR/AcrR family transcriptional regulator [Paracoccaceae bacterium]